MTDSYVSLTLELSKADAELAESTLHDAGALGLEVRDGEGPAMPGVRTPGAGEVILIGFFDSADTAGEARAAIEERFPAARTALEEVVQQDWSNSWKSLIRSVQVGRLWVGPPWETEAAPKEKVRIVIEPKMAFGTGDHPTTTLCLKAVDELLSRSPGASVLDVGTGTGVLAIAAKKLGAGRVVATDNDPISVELSKENAQVNATPDLELSGKSLDQVEGQFDIVLANILANTLVELAPLIAPKVKKHLVLAGVLAHQRQEVEAAFVAQGLSPRGGAAVDEWVRIDLGRD